VTFRCAEVTSYQKEIPSVAIRDKGQRHAPCLCPSSYLPRFVSHGRNFVADGQQCLRAGQGVLLQGHRDERGHHQDVRRRLKWNVPGDSSKVAAGESVAPPQDHLPRNHHRPAPPLARHLCPRRR